MADVLSRAVVAVQATHLSGEDQSRTRSISDLFAWCGDGVVTPNQLHAYLRPDTSESLPHAAALLIRGPSGRRYLVTACHVLSDPSFAGARPQQSMEPDNFEGNEGSGGPCDKAEPVSGMTEIAFDERALPPHLRNGLFPARSFPHLDLSIVWLDKTDNELCTALDQAGFAFVPTDQVDDEPSAEGAEIRVVASSSLQSGEAVLTGKTVGKGHARGLSAALSFFWIDAELPSSFASAPVVEGDRIVGFLSPQQVNPATNLSSSFATIMKASSLKTLLAAHEASR